MAATTETWEPLIAPPAGLDPAAAPLWWCVQGNRLLVGDGGALPGELPPDAAASDALFLGLLDGRPCWADDAGPASAVDGFTFVDLFSLHPALGERRWVIAGRAVQLVDWMRSHRFCGRCGAETEVAPGERARRCPSCGLLAFPRLAPAVITLVQRDDEALLARGVTFGVPMYSCIAGFVEPGETFEEAVAREVLEESGVRVRDVGYVMSQPWPFPSSLMIGCHAYADDPAIVVDKTELDDARWFSRAEVTEAMDAVLRGEEGKAFGAPPPTAVAHHLLKWWIARG